MTLRTTADFRRDLAALPAPIRRQARDAFRQFIAEPNHPSLRFKKLPPHDDLWSVRISKDYRAIARWKGDVLLWFFIGSHADYDKLIARQ